MTEEEKEWYDKYPLFRELVGHCTKSFPFVCTGKKEKVGENGCEFRCKCSARIKV